MATIKLGQRIIFCAEGENLRRVLLDNQIALYNGPSKVINCLGLGTCGTCAVAITGLVSEPTFQEKVRAPLLKGRRLACQVQVIADITVTKYDGIWGLGQNIMPL